MNRQSNAHSTTAPWPGQDDGDTGRQQRGLAIAAFGSRSEGPPWLRCTLAVQQWFLHSCEVEKEDEVETT